MVKRADVTVEWANGEYLFALKGKQIEMLEAESFNPTTGKPGVGLGAIWQRITNGSWFYSDIRNVIRLGLMGGGMGAVEAKRMVQDYVEGVPASTVSTNTSKPNCPLLLAQVILAAAVIGVESEEDNPDPGEDKTPKK